MPLLIWTFTVAAVSSRGRTGLRQTAQWPQGDYTCEGLKVSFPRGDAETRRLISGLFSALSAPLREHKT